MRGISISVVAHPKGAARHVRAAINNIRFLNCIQNSNIREYCVIKFRMIFAAVETIAAWLPFKPERLSKLDDATKLRRFRFHFVSLDHSCSDRNFQVRDRSSNILENRRTRLPGYADPRDRIRRREMESISRDTGLIFTSLRPI
jgi:hypothetical protein